MTTRRPSPGNYNAYYQGYIDQAPDGDIVSVLTEQRERILDVLGGIPTAREDYRYAPGKWTTKEVVGHMLDTEWVFSYRTLRMARNDRTALAGMDQDLFVAGANFADRSLVSMSTEFKHLRTASVELISSFDEEILSRTGTASGFPFTVRSLVFIIAGHAEHHLAVLADKYL